MFLERKLKFYRIIKMIFLFYFVEVEVEFYFVL